MKLCLFLFAILLLACNRDVPTIQRNDDPFILGGQTVDQADELSRSAVQIGTNSRSTCSGTLIADNLVVTAAHCIDSRYRGRTEFRAGFFLQFSETEKREIDGWVFHPDWARNLTATGVEYGDVIVVRFAGSLPEGFRPARVATTKHKLSRGDSVVLAGFGSGELSKVTLPILDASARTYEVRVDQRDGRGACKGDSGGGAYLSSPDGLRLWGVTSRSEGYVNGSAELCQYSAVYSDLRQLEDWINESAALLVR